MNIKETDLTDYLPEELNQKHHIVEQMEQEWPEMTTEFKKIQREQYEFFYTNNTIMAQVIFQLEHNYKHPKK